jgi:hypothetical protein
LLEQAELLAGDISQTVDEMEDRQLRLLGAAAPAWPRRRAQGRIAAVGDALADRAPSLRRIGLGLGAGLVLGGLVSEC